MPEQMSTLVFLDFEATGLGNGKTKVTELALLSVQREELLTKSGIPRVINKLTLCVNPQKLITLRASEITGLYNEHLESQTPFNGHVIDMMVNFLSRLPQPVCLIAHYGNGFDFKLLAAELQRNEKLMPKNLYCADSLEAFRVLDGLPPLYVTPQKSPSDVTTPDRNNRLSPSVESLNNTTPEGQQIPLNSECPNIKEKARQVKRKIDTDLNPIPLQAKACRKRLFDSSGGGEKDELVFKPLDDADIDTPDKRESEKSDLESANPRVDKSNVKKKLDFENIQSPSDTSSKSVTNQNAVETATSVVSEQNAEMEAANLFSQSSIPDDVIFEAACSVEESDEHNVRTCTEKGQGEREESGDDNKNCTEKENSYLIKNEPCKKRDFYDIITQRINTRISYTVSEAKHHDKSKSDVTDSCDHGIHGSISSYETNHTHFRKQQDSSVVTPKKESDSPKVISLDTEAQSEEEVVSERETTSETLIKTDICTPIKENQSSSSGLQDTPVSHYSPRVSYKLIEIYKRTFGHLPPISHAAEDDCVTLMKVVKKKSPEFLHWVDENAVLFSTINPL